MERKLKIGYQGLEKSNNNRAAELLRDRLPETIKASGILLVPLITSERVVSALCSGEIDMGVMAFGATDGWKVPETEKATANVQLEVLDTVVSEIHHFLFRKNSSISLEQIHTVASHQAALLICSEHIKKLLPWAKKLETEDTALAAKMLAEGKLSEDTAVICSKEAGEENGLDLLQADVQDRNPNGVIFKLVRCAEK